LTLAREGLATFDFSSAHLCHDVGGEPDPEAMVRTVTELAQSLLAELTRSQGAGCAGSGKRAGNDTAVESRPAEATAGRKLSDRLPDSYRAQAADYERRTTMFPGWRERLVGLLDPRSGDTVLDVGCGPGLNFGALRRRVGPAGTIVGVDESAEMLAVAARRVALRGWDNVILIHASPTKARLPDADAALLGSAQPILQSARALTHILAHLRPGAPVAVGGYKLPSRYLWPLRICVSRQCVWHSSNGAPLDRPWELLSRNLGRLRVIELGFGTGYFAHGRAASARSRPLTTPLACLQPR
jgi:demethylmenaquinone methyltransferase/2-methoxy-6-polyprenyl-1,4-benzoquinol methylase